VRPGPRTPPRSGPEEFALSSRPSGDDDTGVTGRPHPFRTPPAGAGAPGDTSPARPSGMARDHAAAPPTRSGRPLVRVEVPWRAR